MDQRKTQEAYMMLVRLSKSSSEVITLFKSDWLHLFNPALVPPLQIFDSEMSIVRVNRQAAIDFLKTTYSFYSKHEQKNLLEDIANEIENEC